MTAGRRWIVVAIVLCSGTLASAQGFMRCMRVPRREPPGEREGEDPRYFHEFGPNGYALGINAILYALSH